MFALVSFLQRRGSNTWCQAGGRASCQCNGRGECVTRISGKHSVNDFRFLDTRELFLQAIRLDKELIVPQTEQV